MLKVPLLLSLGAVPSCHAFNLEELMGVTSCLHGSCMALAWPLDKMLLASYSLPNIVIVHQPPPFTRRVQEPSSEPFVAW